MKISDQLTDETVLAELGARIARSRVARQLTQAAAAAQAGISKRTLERIESGASVQLAGFVRLLRVLDLLPRLEQLLPEAAPGPMELLRHKGKARQRASSVEPAATDKPWAWDDES